MKSLFFALLMGVSTLFITASSSIAEDNYQTTTCGVKVVENLDGTWGARFSTRGSANSFSVWSCGDPETGENLVSGSFQYQVDVPVLATDDGVSLQVPFSCSASVQGLVGTCTFTCTLRGGAPDCEATSTSN